MCTELFHSKHTLLGACECQVSQFATICVCKMDIWRVGIFIYLEWVIDTAAPLPANPTQHSTDQERERRRERAQAAAWLDTKCNLWEKLLCKYGEGGSETHDHIRHGTTCVQPLYSVNLLQKQDFFNALTHTQTTLFNFFLGI